jgi:hypothetical protein
MTPEMYAYVAATRAVRGLPPIAKTDPAAIALSLDPHAQRLAAAIKKEVDRSPPLSPDQIEELRGLLPYPTPADSTAA